MKGEVSIQERTFYTELAYHKIVGYNCGFWNPYLTSVIVLSDLYQIRMDLSIKQQDTNEKGA